MWSGSTSNVPTGWNLCDGTSGTPDLTDKFIIGAGGAYSVGGAGGSKDAVVIAHSHDASGTASGGSHTHDVSVSGNHAHDASASVSGSLSHSHDFSGGGNHSHDASGSISGSTSHTHSFSVC